MSPRPPVPSMHTPVPPPLFVAVAPDRAADPVRAHRTDLVMALSAFVTVLALCVAVTTGSGAAAVIGLVAFVVFGRTGVRVAPNKPRNPSC